MADFRFVNDPVRQRSLGLRWGIALLAVFVAITALVVAKWAPLMRFDHWIGKNPEQWTADNTVLRHAALGIQAAFEFAPMTVFTIVVAVLLWLRNHRRAAAYVVGVMVTSTVIVNVVKPLVDRPRPHWDDPITTLTSKSFPSGHATSIAAAATIAIVLVSMLVRRRILRRLLATLAIAIAIIVGADRVFLGVHNFSDVVAGWILGVGTALVWLRIYNPLPVSTAGKVEALPEVFGNRTKLAVVLNPIKVDDVDGFRAMVEELAAESGFETVSWHLTTVEDPGFGQAHSAAVDGAGLVISCGGDGTVRAVCEELAGTGVPVGIVPAGTGNLLARNLGIPLYLRAAVDTALNGQDRAIDMVTATGDRMEDATFLVMAGMGFDAAIMEGVNENVKEKVGWLAYVISGIRSLMYPAVRVEISVDGGSFTKHRARTIVIGNVGFLQAGLPLIPDAEIDDGLLDIVLLYPRRFLSWVPLAVRVLTRSQRSDDTIRRMRGATVTVRASGDTPRQLDGDPIESGKEITATVIPGRLLVRVPR